MLFVFFSYDCKLIFDTALLKVEIANKRQIYIRNQNNSEQMSLIVMIYYFELRLRVKTISMSLRKYYKPNEVGDWEKSTWI